MKKLLGFFVVLALALTLAGCKGGSKKGSLPAYTHKTQLAEGFTSLESKFAHPAAKKGKYVAGGHEFNIKSEYRSFYQTEISNDKLNYLTNHYAHNSEVYTNMVDGLIENDQYGNLVGALAVGYKSVLNADGTQTWTFQIKEKVNWITNDTRKIYAEVVADDFVAGLEYVLDPHNGSGTASIVASLLKGAQEYYDSWFEDPTLPPEKRKLLDAPKLTFAETVGVKEISKYQVEYTLIHAAPYFLSSLTYSPYLPVNREFLEDRGTEFGQTKDEILVNGPFFFDVHRENNKIELVKNPNYYDLEHVYIDKVILRFLASTATEQTTRDWFEAGLIDGFGVNNQDNAGWKKYVTGEDGTGTVKAPANEQCNAVPSVGDASYGGLFNFKRNTFEYTKAEDVWPAGAEGEAMKKATQAAIHNKDFRLGILYGTDVVKTFERFGEDRKFDRLYRAWTCRELASHEGKDFADLVDEVYNEKQGTTGVTLTGVNGQKDPVYSPEKAKIHFDAAFAALEAEGVWKPGQVIRMDTIGITYAPAIPYYDAMFKSIEDNSEGRIKVVQNRPKDDDQRIMWMWGTYNYDFHFNSGWGPDYADPQTFLHCFAIGGEMLSSLGIADDGELQQKILGEYDAIYKQAAEIVDPTRFGERLQKFAEAEYALIYEYALCIPMSAPNGISPVVSRTLPYQANRAPYGLSRGKHKNVVVTDSILTQELRNAVVEEYEANKK